jgi:NAD(P)-dependent dehydrogenase (short-subunit alcohol dehydrogenase family)
MTADLGFDGRVAVISGAGGGLGRAHALLLASRGARVVVNDLGGSLDGKGSSQDPANAVVEEIRAAGGEAVPDTHSVATAEGGQAVIDTAVSAFGRVDIVVNNAGILRDRSFANLSEEEMDAVLTVHLKGAFHLTQPAWRHMREAGYGRIVMTSSAAGLLGNFGQANYGAAKMSLVGLAKVLSVEGAKQNIKTNVIAPIARTRMTEELLGSLADRVDPALTSPLVAWLCHEDCQVSGHIYTVGGGRVARMFIGMGPGWTRKDGQLTVEDVRDHFGEIDQTDGATVPESLTDDFRALARALR